LEQQISKRRVKRDLYSGLFNDPMWPRLWYLVSCSRFLVAVELFLTYFRYFFHIAYVLLQYCKMVNSTQ